MFIRGRYGHGGRVGYDKEWRADPALVRRRRADRPGRPPDRSVALVPRRLRDVDGFAAHLLLGHAGRRQRVPDAAHRRRPGRLAARRAAPSGRTCSRSRSTAATASSHIDGLGGSYGVERLTFYRMLPEMGPPETTSWEYPARRTTRGRSSSRSSSKTFGRSASRPRGLRRRARRARVVEEIYPSGRATMLPTR